MSFPTPGRQGHFTAGLLTRVCSTQKRKAAQAAFKELTAGLPADQVIEAFAAVLEKHPGRSNTLKRSSEQRARNIFAQIFGPNVAPTTVARDAIRDYQVPQQPTANVVATPLPSYDPGEIALRELICAQDISLDTKVFMIKELMNQDF